MGKIFNGQFSNFFSCTASSRSESVHQSDMDVRDEYANAFRTESYNEFWARVIALTDKSSTKRSPAESTTAARLPSYRLFAEHLLDPDQPTVTRILASARHKPTFHALLSEYFLETANASIQYSHLLKEIDRARMMYKALKASLQTIAIANNGSLDQFPAVLARLTAFSNSLNPFLSSSFLPSRVGTMQDKCSNLLKRLESSRDKVRAKLRNINRVKHGSAYFLVAVTASLAVVVAAHSVALLVAVPGFIMVTVELAQTKKLAKLSRQLDTAAKGTYILNRDLDTISRLVARLNDEVEHMRDMVKFWVGRGEDRLYHDGEVARLLKKNNCSFTEQLDELEEHLYLCFMTRVSIRSGFLCFTAAIAFVAQTSSSTTLRQRGGLIPRQPSIVTDDVDFVEGRPFTLILSTTSSLGDENVNEFDAFAIELRRRAKSVVLFNAFFYQ